MPVNKDSITMIMGTISIEAFLNLLAIQQHCYAYASAPAVMNTPRRANEIGLWAMASACREWIPETNHHWSRNRLGSSTQVGASTPSRAQRYSVIAASRASKRASPVGTGSEAVRPRRSATGARSKSSTHRNASRNAPDSSPSERHAPTWRPTSAMLGRW